MIPPSYLKLLTQRISTIVNVFLGVTERSTRRSSLIPMIRVGMSTSCVFPLPLEEAFRLARLAGFDGVEIMVTNDTSTQDAATLLGLSRSYGIPILSIHAPVLLATQLVWGTTQRRKLEKSAELARAVGASTVVVHPPFRWQRRYADGFSDQVAALEESSEVMVAVENMFPFRADRFFGADQTRERMRRRGGGPGAGISAFAPSYDPLDGNHAHYTLDLSHTSTAGTDALEMAERMGAGLVHLHLCDGSGSPSDEHLVPGRGTEPTAETCEMLANSQFAGHVILEVSTSSARSAHEREVMLAESLQFARTHLLR
jgi:sugar phosphate isomerase/epimerase